MYVYRKFLNPLKHLSFFSLDQEKTWYFLIKNAKPFDVNVNYDFKKRKRLHPKNSQTVRWKQGLNQGGKGWVERYIWIAIQQKLRKCIFCSFQQALIYASPCRRPCYFKSWILLDQDLGIKQFEFKPLS